MSRDMNPEKIAILVDSCADLSPKQMKGKPIYLVPLRILCGNKEYHDGENITNEDIYRRQEKGELPRTSLPEITRVDKALEKIGKDGYEKVIALPLSSGLSGTYNMVRLECLDHRELECAAFETFSASLGVGMVVLQLWEDIQAGMSWETLVNERVPFLLKNTTPYFSVDTLEYLQKGGRIGMVTAVAGTLLNIKPILGFTQDGQLTSVAKVRGRKAINSKFIELLRGHLGEHKVFNLAVANGGDPKGMAELKTELESAFPGFGQMWEATMDATLATYVGKGMLGVGIQVLD